MATQITPKHEDDNGKPAPAAIEEGVLTVTIPKKAGGRAKAEKKIKIGK